MALQIREIFKEHTANGSSKRWKTAVLRARTAGLKRSPSGVWLLLRGSKTILASRPRIGKCWTADGTYALREPAEAYARNLTGENEALSSENTLPWNESLENPGR